MSIDSQIEVVLKDIRKIIAESRSAARRNINSLQVISNFLIGKRLIESEQQGKKRAEYGKETLKKLSVKLTKEFGRGYSATNLEYMRKFYRIYKDHTELIPQTSSKKPLCKNLKHCLRN